MKVEPECIPCILKQALRGAKLIQADKAIQHRLLNETMDYLKTISLDSHNPPGITSHLNHGLLKRILNHPDPYYEVKLKYNQIGLDLYPELKSRVKESADPLHTAAKLAIAGNCIDFGVGDGFDLEGTIEQILNSPLARDAYQAFKMALKEAGEVLYLADNAGELVFDKIFIEELLEEGGAIFRVVVKSAPIINDATMDDARFVGLDGLVPIVTNTADVGTPLDKSSLEVKSLFEQADLIISKGQGNYETLGENTTGKIFFFLQAKCDIIAKVLGVDLGQAVLIKS
ncbi:MAG: ARMT1-like domain-containing protein [bacterium]|nr:ARMT1-like domain-containing protein [bacterium]